MKLTKQKNAYINHKLATKQEHHKPGKKDPHKELIEPAMPSRP